MFLKTDLNENVPLSRIYKILQKQPFYLYQVKKIERFPRRFYDVQSFAELFQADLAHMFDSGDGYSYFLLVTDVFSNKIWTFPLKTKAKNEVKDAFEKLFSSLTVLPTIISTDEGNKLYFYFVKSSKTLNYFFCRKRICFVERLFQVQKNPSHFEIWN